MTFNPNILQQSHEPSVPGQPLGYSDGQTVLFPAPDDDFGRRVFAIADGGPEIQVSLAIADAKERHERNEDRFLARTLLPSGVHPKLDKEREQYEEHLQDLLPGYDGVVPKMSIRAIAAWAKRAPESPRYTPTNDKAKGS